MGGSLLFIFVVSQEQNVSFEQISQTKIMSLQAKSLLFNLLLKHCRPSLEGIKAHEEN